MTHHPTPLTPTERALIAEAVAAGRVTICPPCTYSDPGGPRTRQERAEAGRRRFAHAQRMAAAERRDSASRQARARG